MVRQVLSGKHGSTQQTELVNRNESLEIIGSESLCYFFAVFCFFSSGSSIGPYSSPLSVADKEGGDELHFSTSAKALLQSMQISGDSRPLLFFPLELNIITHFVFNYNRDSRGEPCKREHSLFRPVGIQDD